MSSVLLLRRSQLGWDLGGILSQAPGQRRTAAGHLRPFELYDDSGSEFYYVDRTAIVPVQLKAPEQESGMTMTL